MTSNRCRSTRQCAWKGWGGSGPRLPQGAHARLQAAAHSPAAAGGGGLRQGRGPVLTVRSRPRRPAGRRRPGLASGAARPGWGGLRADAAPMSAAGALASLRVRRARGSCGSGSQPRRSGPRSRGAGSPRRCAAPCSADSERCGAVSPRSHARAGPGKSCRQADGERRESGESWNSPVSQRKSALSAKQRLW